MENTPGMESPLLAAPEPGEEESQAEGELRRATSTKQVKRTISNNSIASMGLTSPPRPFSPYRPQSPRPPSVRSLDAQLKFTTADSAGSRYLHVAMEYVIPFVRYYAVYGGLGKIVDIILSNSKEKLALICPMYKDFPLEEAKKQKDWHYSKTQFCIEPAHVTHEMTIHSFTNGFRTYLLVACDFFSTYSSKEIYQWCRNAMEIIFLSVFNQSVAHILAAHYFKTVHFHDYHGVLSLLYDLRDKGMQARRALITVHNGDCQGSFPCTETEQADFLINSFCLHPNVFRDFCISSGTMNMLGSFVRYCQKYQNGMGVSTISERHKDRIMKKHSLFWPLKEINVIPNGVDESEIHRDIKDIGKDRDKLKALRERNKRAVQQRYGLEENVDVRLLSFMGRLVYQKGCDLIADIVDRLAALPNVQIVVVGPHNDSWGEAVATVFREKMQNLANCYFQDAAVTGAEREELMRATDFVLMPSRFEPFGLVDVEFGWRGALTIGSNVDGLGKMPGFYFPIETVFKDRIENDFYQAAVRALSSNQQTITQLQFAAMATRFPVQEMLAKYERYAANVQLSYDQADTFLEVLAGSVRVETKRQNLFDDDDLSERPPPKRKGGPLTLFGSDHDDSEKEAINLDTRYGTSGSGSLSPRDHKEMSYDSDGEVDKRRRKRGSISDGTSSLDQKQGGQYIVDHKIPDTLTKRENPLRDMLFGKGEDSPQDTIDIDANSFAHIYIRRANVLWPADLNPWRIVKRAVITPTEPQNICTLFCSQDTTTPRHQLFYWLTWALYITSAIPSAILFFDAAHTLNNSKNGTFIALLYATNGLGSAVGSMTWAKMAFDLTPRTVLTLAALANGSILLTLITPGREVSIALLTVVGAFSGFAGPVCIGLNYLAESPEKEVSVGIRAGIGDFLRFAIAGILALSFISVDSDSSRDVFHASIVVCIVIISFVMVVVFWSASPSQYKMHVLPRERQMELFLLRRVPMFVFINCVFDAIGTLTVAAAGVNFLLNENWTETDWLEMFFSSVCACGMSSAVAGYFIHRNERSGSSYANPLNLLYVPAGYCIKAIMLALCYKSSVAVVIAIMTFCDFIGYSRNLSINYAMITSLHRELFIVGTALRASLEGSLNFILGLLLSAVLDYADKFVENSSGIVLTIAMVGFMTGALQWIISFLLFGYYKRERLNIP